MMEFDRWDGVVFDLDGTVVWLRVDWTKAEEAVFRELQKAGVDTKDQRVWPLLELAAERGILDRIEPTLNEFEFEGAERSKRLPLADSLSAFDGPIGICSLNCEEACRRALAVHGLDEYVDVVIGRDTIRPWKPDPAPLEAAVQKLGTPPEQTLFVGDSDRDATTAEAAGIPFRYVEDILESVDS